MDANPKAQAHTHKGVQLYLAFKNQATEREDLMKEVRQFGAR